MSRASKSTIDLLVETPIGTVLEMTVSPNDTISLIKDNIYRVKRIPVAQQHLFDNTTELEDEWSLRDLDISDGARLRLVLSAPTSEPSCGSLRLASNKDEVDCYSHSDHMTLLYVYGERFNMMQMKVNFEDRTYTPVDPHIHSGRVPMPERTGARTEPEDEHRALQENAATMNTMKELRRTLEELFSNKTNSGPDLGRVPILERTEASAKSEGERGALQKNAAAMTTMKQLRCTLEELFPHRTKTRPDSGRVSVPEQTRWIAEPEGTSRALHENAVTKGKMLDLRRRMEALSLRRTDSRPDNEVEIQNTRNKVSLSQSLPLEQILQYGDCIVVISRSNFTRYEMERGGNDLYTLLPSIATMSVDSMEGPVHRQGRREDSAILEERLAAEECRQQDSVASGPGHDYGLLVTDGAWCAAHAQSADSASASALPLGATLPPPEPLSQAMSSSSASELQSASRIRCSLCKKRLSIATVHQCRCGAQFCGSHRYAEEHGCSYDYKAEPHSLLVYATTYRPDKNLPRF